MTVFAVRRANQLEEPVEENKWLVDELWMDRAVGIVGGEPKCCKSYLALEIAVAVASGRPCLRRFPVAEPGPVLLYAAEDALPIVRQRLEQIASASGVSIFALDVYVITEPVVRLDLCRDQDRLEETVEWLQPRLLILDPFVRLHRVDENVAGAVAPMLASLRQIERRFGCAVLLVHHARKGAAGMRHGQALRGSSELHAWGDSNLYLRRQGDALRLAVEHRAARSPNELQLRLEERDQSLALRVVDDTLAQEATPQRPRLGPDERIVQALASCEERLGVRALREATRMRTATLCERLASLVANGKIVKDDVGYRLHESVSVAARSLRESGNGNGKRDSSGETEAGSAEEQPAKG